MAIHQPVRRGIEEAAIGRVLEIIHQQHRNGRRIFTLLELAEATAIDPPTVEDVMQTLEDTGPYDVEPLGFGEIRWCVEGCVYNLDGWQSDVWNAD